jgi:parallel beta-helix repeat protein
LGINCWGDDYNNIHNNTFIRCSGGISLGWSEHDVPQYNNVFNNTIALSSQGIYLVGAVNNNIFDNIIISNYAGIYMLSSEGNNIYNNYLDNTMPLYNARDNGYNPWNASKKLGENIVGGPYIGGNYYSDYIGKDGDSDGFGDTPYAIPGGYSVDYMPLILYKHRFPIPTLLSVDYQESVELDDWINITITASNNGGTATWQTIHCGFPNCTSTENMEIVTHNLEGAQIYPTGSLLPAKYGETIKNSTYVIVEGVQGIWSYGEQHSMTVRIKPGKVGLFTLYVKTVSFVEYLPFFNQTETTDQQNEYVSVYTVRVTTPRASIEVKNIESKPWSLLNVPFEDIADAKDYVLNFVKNGKPEAEFGTIPINITITNIGQMTAKNVEIDATITGVAGLASLDESARADDYVYLHPFNYKNSFSIGTIGVTSTRNVTIEIPVKYAHVFTGVFKYNEEDEADILFIATELKVDLEIGGTNTNTIQESMTLTGIADPLDLGALALMGVLERLKDKLTDELYQQMREYVYVISGGLATTNFPITADTHTINTQIKPGTTGFSISAFIPFGIELVELTVTVGMFTLGMITTAAVNGFAFLIIKPPDLRYGDAQITIKTTETTALVLVMRNSFKPFNLTTIEILSENIRFDHKITFENKSYNLHFNSNCTVFDIKFNDTKKMISFEMAGQESSVGFCNVTIPKELLRANTTHPWKVKLNDSDSSFTSAENATHSFVYFDVTDTGTYTIEIIGAEVIPEFPAWIMPPSLMVLTMLTAIQRKKRKKTDSHPKAIEKGG